MDHQAIAQLMGNYGEFIGAIAVVGTLFYLAIQVRHSRDAMDASSKAIEESHKSAEAAVMHSYWTGISTSIAYPVQNAELARLVPIICGDSRTLTEDNWVQAGLFIQLNCRAFQNSFLLHEKGFLDEEVFNAEMGMARMNLALPGFKQWWEAAGRNQFAPRFKTATSRKTGDGRLVFIVDCERNTGIEFQIRLFEFA